MGWAPSFVIAAGSLLNRVHLGKGGIKGAKKWRRQLLRCPEPSIRLCSKLHGVAGRQQREQSGVALAGACGVRGAMLCEPESRLPRPARYRVGEGRLDSGSNKVVQATDGSTCGERRGLPGSGAWPSQQEDSQRGPSFCGRLFLPWLTESPNPMPGEGNVNTLRAGARQTEPESQLQTRSL